MEFRSRIARLDEKISFAEPVSEERLVAAERDLGVQLPSALRGVFRETDGVAGAYESALVWPLERIVRDNLWFRAYPDYRELFMPFDRLLFFADAGNGDQFAHPISAAMVCRPDVFVWNHEDDSRNWAAPDLVTYLEWWLDGTMKI
jgi:hypothetical protein